MLETVVFAAFCVLGLYAAMGDGMVLEWLRIAFERVTDSKLLRYIRPALYDCPICMASIWGTIIWVVIGLHHPEKRLFDDAWILYVFGVAGFNYLAVNLISSDE